MDQQITVKPETTPAQPWLRDVLILAVLTLGIGVYLIGTTVVISKDGTFYVENTRNILIRPLEVLNARPVGYELMVLAVHELWETVTGELSFRSQIWIAQGVTLTCRAAAIVALYFIGRILVGRKGGFGGCVILVFLPESAHMGSDALRDWPYLMLLTLGVLCFLKGVRNRRVWYFALTGLAAGLGFLIRLESIQLLLLGIATAGILIAASSEKKQRYIWAGGIVLLAAGFAVPKLIYAGYTGQVATQYLKHYNTYAQSTLHVTPEEPQAPEDMFDSTLPQSGNRDSLHTEPGRTLGGLGYEVFKDLGELLVWFFLPFWFIGVWGALKNKHDPLARGIVAAVLLMGFGMIATRYWLKEPVVSVRWVVPIVALTVFYVYAGIEWTARKLAGHKANHEKSIQKWICVLAGIGVLACLPKLLKPLGADKAVYRDAIDWIKDNTEPGDWFYTFDRRIVYYTNRPYHIYDNDNGLPNELFDTSYLVTPGKNQRPTIALPDDAVFETGFERKGKEVLIYRRVP